MRVVKGHTRSLDSGSYDSAPQTLQTLRHTIELAGRLPQLSQSTAKQFLFVAAGQSICWLQDLGILGGKCGMFSSGCSYTAF